MTSTATLHAESPTPSLPAASPARRSRRSGCARALALLLLSASSLAAAAPQCGEDQYEDNDTCGTAWGILVPFIDTSLRVYKTDHDYFRLTVPPGQVLDVDLFFSHAAGDIDLFLYDANGPCGGPFNFLQQSVSSTNDESITWTNLGSEDFDVIIKVLVFPGSLAVCNEYDISVTLAPPFDPCDPALNDDGFEENDTCQEAVPLPFGLTQNLWVSRTDPDFYWTTVQAGQTLDVRALFVDSIADIDIFLYRRSGPCGGGFQSGELASGFSQTDNERIIWSNTSGSPIEVVLEVEVFNTDNCNDYDLDVSVSGGSIGSNYCQANPNSTGLIGLIRAVGSTSVAANSVTLNTTQLPPNQFGLFVVSATQGFVMNPGGSAGNLCVIGQVGRYTQSITNSGSSGAISLPIDLTVIPLPNTVTAVAPGQTWHFQLWHREVGAGGSNLTNGLRITFQP